MELRLRIKNRILESVTSRPDSGARIDFVQNFKMVKMSKMVNHSHPEAARARNESFRAIENWIVGMGLKPYHISMSNREHGDGIHELMWAKDFSTPRVRTPLKAEHFIMGIDVDYYLKLSKIRHLARKGNPIIFYSAMPRQLSGDCLDGHYTIEKDGRFHMRVNGGADYPSDLWNYDLDTVVFDYWWGSRIYAVEKREVDDIHAIVLLAPIAKVTLPILTRYLINGPRLKRRTMLDGDFAIMRYTQPVEGKSSMWISVTRCGDYTSANVPESCFAAIEISFDQVTKGVSFYGVMNILKEYGIHRKEAVSASRILVAYFNYKSGKRVEITETRMWNGTIEASNYVNAEADSRVDSQADLKIVGRNLHPPITDDPTTIPAATQANDLAAVRGRVEKIRNTKVPPNQYLAWASEFVSLTVGDHAHTVEPWNIDQVIDEQRSTPQQIGRNANTLPWLTGESWLPGKLRVKSFMKKEVANGSNHPRNISTLPTDHNLELSRFTYAVKHAILKHLEWYAPGKTPEQIARRLTTMAEFRRILEADGNRFDGSISDWLYRHVKRPIYLAAIALGHRRELQQLLDREVNTKGVTSTGDQYDPGTGTLSGSPTTTDGNTLYTGFIDYCSLRTGGYSAVEAFRLLGQHAGDDATSVAEEKHWLKVAKDLGMTYTCITHTTETDTPVGFLGRKFPYLFVGGDGSLQDPLRQANKLHYTFAPKSIDLPQALVNKAIGLETLDPSNPLISAWASAVRRIHGDQVTGDHDMPYWFKISDGSWPQLTEEEYWIQFAALTGIAEGEFLQLILALRDSNSEEDLHNLPVLHVPNPTLDKVAAQQLDDPMVTPPPPPPDTIAEELEPGVWSVVSITTTPTTSSSAPSPVNGKQRASGRKKGPKRDPRRK